MVCDRALPAADFDAALVRPSRSTLEAAVAACADVCSWGAPFCVSALPAALLEALPVDWLDSTLEAAEAVAGRVVVVAIGFSFT